MIEATGIVTALDGSHAIVLVEETGCGRCHEEGGCGGNNLGRMFCSTPKTFRVLNPEKAAVGDRVVVAVAGDAVRRSAVLAYGFPLLALFSGAIGGTFLAGETGAMIGAAVGMFAAWLLLRFSGVGIGSSNRDFQPYIKLVRRS